jgi:hypothetical protein
MTDSNIETVSHCHQQVTTLKRETDSPHCVLFPSQRDVWLVQSPWLRKILRSTTIHILIKPILLQYIYLSTR